MRKANYLAQLCSIILLHAGLRTASAETVYRNSEYGFSVSIPRWAKPCYSTAPNPNHGIILLLEASNSCDKANVNKLEGQRFVAVSASWNSEEYGSLTSYWNATCLRPWRRSVGNFSIAGLSARECVLHGSSGKIGISRVALSKADPGEVPDEEYQVFLSTDKSHYDEDRAILDGQNLRIIINSHK